MTDIRLRAMREDEFGPWLAAVTEDYAAETARNGKVSASAAAAEAEAVARRLLPAGLATPNHVIAIAEHADSGERVGFLWYARERHGDREVAWLYDIVVDEPHRGRGFGRGLMKLLEERARAVGLDRIELNVYGDNERARSLYESLGYRETARQLFKEL